jgi:hypothetical protein
MKVLFLDVDGVLNRCAFSTQELEPEKVDLLRWIIESADPIVVVSSTWRRYPQRMERLHAMLAQIGARYGGCTPDSENQVGSILVAKSRGAEIQQWMDSNRVPDIFVILDDDPNMDHLLPHLIRTKSSVGLTPEIARNVIKAFRINENQTNL